MPCASEHCGCGDALVPLRAGPLSRRRFLQLLGVGGVAALPGCFRAPPDEVAPYVHTPELVQPGKLSPDEYKKFVADLTNFLVYAAEPGREHRKEVGWHVLAFLLVFFVLAYLLKKEYWKDVH